MRYAHSSLGKPPVGVEPQPNHTDPRLATIKLTDDEHANVITITDRDQALDAIQLIQDAIYINGWLGPS